MFLASQVKKGAGGGESVVLTMSGKKHIFISEAGIISSWTTMLEKFKQ